MSEADDGLVIGVLQASGARQDGTPGAYGATHVFTVRDGKIVRFREYTDLDASPDEALLPATASGSSSTRPTIS